jgi:hypothetical protein
MKMLLPLFLFSRILTSCTTVPPVSGTIVTKQGEVTVLPDGRLEIVVQPLSEK